MQLPFALQTVPSSCRPHNAKSIHTAKPTTSSTAFSLGFRGGIILCSQQLGRRHQPTPNCMMPDNVAARNTGQDHAVCWWLMPLLGHLLASFLASTESPACRLLSLELHRSNRTAVPLIVCSYWCAGSTASSGESHAAVVTSLAFCTIVASIIAGKSAGTSAQPAGMQLWQPVAVHVHFLRTRAETLRTCAETWAMTSGICRLHGGSQQGRNHSLGRATML